MMSMGVVQNTWSSDIIANINGDAMCEGFSCPASPNPQDPWALTSSRTSSSAAYCRMGRMPLAARYATVGRMLSTHSPAQKCLKNVCRTAQSTAGRATRRLAGSSQPALSTKGRHAHAWNTASDCSSCRVDFACARATRAQCYVGRVLC